ncbi:MAG: hypothetical protein BHV75_17095 [Bacteroides oleiciplenus]|uniref:Uncharacterized protein n=3 Tax=Bacteroides stercorirosoris TaxID=871324 RepID=A0A1M6JB10_9BACE|nr:MAG: hypothetical protein BHV75_17095 [Bacteroides oleiciplenus]RGX77507.1 hypothetical protein DXA68_15245 [Bacteroides stercorirosoris]SHJ43860.1 hypothetical protein SAMN05444350_12818 [Bacteroides stercorirosoris]
MAVKDSKKTARRMMVVAVVIGLAALALDIVAITMQQWIIAIGMTFVIALQTINFLQWKKRLK